MIGHGANIALGKAMTRSAWFRIDWAPAHAVDGPPSNGSDWLTPNGATGEYVTVNLGALYDVGEVTLCNTRNLDQLLTLSV